MHHEMHIVNSRNGVWMTPRDPTFVGFGSSVKIWVSPRISGFNDPSEPEEGRDIKRLHERTRNEGTGISVGRVLPCRLPTEVLLRPSSGTYPVKKLFWQSLYRGKIYSPLTPRPSPLGHGVRCNTDYDRLTDVSDLRSIMTHDEGLRRKESRQRRGRPIRKNKVYKRKR